MRAETADHENLRRLTGVALLLGAIAFAVMLATATAATAASPQPRGAASVGSAFEVGGADDPAASASVIGGKNAKIQDYPSLAYIQGAAATAAYACTGTVVAPRVILTAGHCVEDLESRSITQPGQIAAATGVSNLKHIPDAKISKVRKVLAYPHFNVKKLQGDVGLLILRSPVAAPPVALAGPEDAALYAPDTPLTVAGWGVNDRGSGRTPNQLQAATESLEGAQRCKKGTKRFYPLFDPDHQICALDTPKLHISACHGDSGGPAFATRPDGTVVEIGITSLGDTTCKPTNPAVFTRVDGIATWVQRWIAAVESGGPQPTVKIPKAHLPRLTLERSEELSALAMEEAFGPKFVKAKERKIQCRRVGKARLNCGVTWFKGPTDYFGTIAVFYAIRRNVVLPGVHYEIHSVNDQCYFHSGHRKTCRVQTKRK